MSNETTYTIEQTAELIAKAEALYESAAQLDKGIIDADTILADMVEKCSFEGTGFAIDVFNIWKASSDKKAVEEMFFEFTGVEFGEYLEKCIAETTKK